MKTGALFLPIGILFSLMGCGLAKVAEDTRDQVKASNDKQEQLLQEIKKTEAETSRLRELTEQLVRGMARTNEGVHLQILTLSLQGLLSTDATDLLMPPVRMMPYAEAFTKEGTADEILQVVHALITEVLLGFDKEASGNKRIRNRMVALTAASALAAFTPKEKTEEIFRTQVEIKGRFEDSAYIFGLCRYNFTRDYFLKSVLNSQTLNIDSLKKAVEHFSALKYLATRPYTDRFKIKADQLIAVDPPRGIYQDLVDQLKQTELNVLGRGAIRRFEHPDTGLNVDVLHSKEAQDLLAAFR